MQLNTLYNFLFDEWKLHWHNRPNNPCTYLLILNFLFFRSQDIPKVGLYPPEDLNGGLFYLRNMLFQEFSQRTVANVTWWKLFSEGVHRSHVCTVPVGCPRQLIPHIRSSPSYQHALFMMTGDPRNTVLSVIKLNNTGFDEAPAPLSIDYYFSLNFISEMYLQLLQLRSWNQLITQRIYNITQLQVVEFSNSKLVTSRL